LDVDDYFNGGVGKGLGNTGGYS